MAVEKTYNEIINSPEFISWFGDWRLLQRAKDIYKTDVKGLYKGVFDIDVEEALFTVSVQMHSSVKNMTNGFSQEILDIAEALYPNTKLGDEFYPVVSKVVDKDGKPLVVYHGFLSYSKKDWFHEFNRLPAFFSANRQFAEDYASTKSMDAGLDMDANSYQCFLNIKKLFDPENKMMVELAREKLPEKIKVSHGTMWFLDADLDKEYVVEMMSGIQTIYPDHMTDDILKANVGDILKEKVSMSQYEERLLLYKDEDWAYTVDRDYFYEKTEKEVAEYISKGDSYSRKSIKYKDKYFEPYVLDKQTYRMKLNEEPIAVEFRNDLEKYRKDFIQNIKTLKRVDETDRHFEIPLKSYETLKNYWGGTISISKRNLKAYKVKAKDNWTMFENETVQKFLTENGFGGWIAFEKGDKTYAVYEPQNIKLADGTNTTFDINNKDIRFSNGGGLDKTLKEVCDDFNDRIREIAKGDNKNHKPLFLGMPNDILLSCGFPNLKIEMAVTRLTDKKMQSNHPFSFSSVIDMPEHIANPIAIFQSKTRLNSKVVFTEMEQSGVNMVVAIETNVPYKDGFINSTRSLYQKDNIKEILSWICEHDLMEYVDKKKASDWLSKQQSNSADVTQLIKRTTNIIQNFENPKNIEKKKEGGRVINKVYNTDNQLVRKSTNNANTTFDSNNKIRFMDGGNVDKDNLGHDEKTGKEFWFEYHCFESCASSDAEAWYHSHQKVKVLFVSTWGNGNTPQERGENGEPRVYRVKFNDGLEWDVFEDELMDSPEEFYRPDPPKKPIKKSNITGFEKGGAMNEKLNILYLHGLDATPESDHASILESDKVNIIAPYFDYNRGDVFNFISNEIIDKEKIDGIVGHSFGGCLAYYLSNKHKKPCLIFNPAFENNEMFLRNISKHTKSINPYDNQMAVVGLKDKDVPAETQLEVLKNGNTKIYEEEIAHDIPDKIKVKYFRMFVDEIKTKKTFNNGGGVGNEPLFQKFQKLKLKGYKELIVSDVRWVDAAQHKPKEYENWLYYKGIGGWDFGRIKENIKVRTKPTHFGKWEYRYGTVLQLVDRSSASNVWRVQWDDGEISNIAENLIEKTKYYGHLSKMKEPIGTFVYDLKFSLRDKESVSFDENELEMMLESYDTGIDYERSYKLYHPTSNFPLTYPQFIRAINRSFYYYNNPKKDWYEHGHKNINAKFYTDFAVGHKKMKSGGAVVSDVKPTVDNLGFYSPIEKRILEFKSDRASVNKWKDIVGVKSDEAKFMGLSDYLNSKKPDEQLFKIEILNFIKDNHIELILVNKNDSNTFLGETYIKERENGTFALAYRDTDEFVNDDEFDSPQEVIDVYENEEIYSGNDVPYKTKYSKYVLSGESKNYNEVLIMLPDEAQKNRLFYNKLFNILTEQVKQRLGIISDSIEWNIFNLYDYKGKLTTDELHQLNYIDGLANKRIPTFTTNHWDEKNILVHLRFDIRTDINGNDVMLVSEIQSDHAQKYRRYKNHLNKFVDENPEYIIEMFKKSGKLNIEC